MTRKDYAIIERMTLYGGSFVRALAEAARAADAENLARIKAAWPEYWEKYGIHPLINKRTKYAATMILQGASDKANLPADGYCECEKKRGGR